MKKEYYQDEEYEAERRQARSIGTIGMDLGDKTSGYCVLKSSGEMDREAAVARR